MKHGAVARFPLFRVRQQLPRVKGWSNGRTPFAPLYAVRIALFSLPPRYGYHMQDVSEDISEVTFDDLDLPKWLTDRIAEVGYETPTPVQAAAIPAVRSGSDVVAQAQTGTGKTAAFAIPLLADLDPKSGPVQALLLTPTRELAQQVSDEFSTLGADGELQSFSVYGGVSMEPQYEAFKSAQVIIGTPGRLLDHLRRGTLKLDNLRVFGLDEADEMLSMGFEREISEILSLLPEKRQNLLFSATMPGAVLRFANTFLTEPQELNLSSDSVGAASVRHLTYNIGGAERLAALRALLRSHTVRGAIIFANTKAETFRVHEQLVSEGYSAGVLNGDLPQRDREKILQQLKAESLDFLVATDIAARGIDISWLRAVINYEMPSTPEIYIHRTGRTGRAGTVGTAYSLITPGDVSVFHALNKLYDIRFEKGTLPTRDDVRALRADEQIDALLETLDEDQRLVYGKYLAIARRLSERGDGAREVAKLLAFYEQAQSAHHQGVAPRQQEAAPQREAAMTTAASKAAPADAQPPARSQPSQTSEPRQEARAPRKEQQAPTEAPKDASPAPATEVQTDPKADRIVEWISNNSRSKPPTRSAHAIAKALGMTEDEVNAVGNEDFRLERLSGRNVRWRLLPEAQRDVRRPAKATPQHDADQGVQREQRVERIEDTQAQPPAPQAPSQAPRVEEPAPIYSTERLDIPESWVRLRVNVGRDNFKSDQDLGRWFAEYAGFDSSDIRKVNCEEKSATVEVDENYWRDFVEALHNQAWNGHQLHVHRAR